MLEWCYRGEQMNNRIKELRKALGLSQTEFSEKIGLNHVSVSLFESGTREISKRTRLAILREFRVNPVWFDTGEGDMFLPIKQKDEIIQFAERIVNADDTDIRKKLFKLLAELSPQDWQIIESAFNKIKEVG